MNNPQLYRRIKEIKQEGNILPLGARKLWRKIGPSYYKYRKRMRESFMNAKYGIRAVGMEYAQTELKLFGNKGNCYIFI